jgi:hypothetical protein
MGEKIMSNTINVRELATEVHRLARLYPDRVAVCSYVLYDDTEGLVPNCIVGLAANNLGISLDDLFRVNNCGIRYLVAGGRPEWLSVGKDDNTHVAWLSHLQLAQDNGECWGEALHRADRWVVMDQFGI